MSTLGPEGQRSPNTLELVDVLIKPHYGAKTAKYSYVTDELLQKVANTESCVLYALDDDSALKVIDGSIEVVGGGEAKVFTPAA